MRANVLRIVDWKNIDWIDIDVHGVESRANGSGGYASLTIRIYIEIPKKEVYQIYGTLWFCHSFYIHSICFHLL